MTARGPAPRTAGWVLAGTAATALLCGAAAVALAAEWQEPVLFVDLGALPPSAPAVAAVAIALLLARSGRLKMRVTPRRGRWVAIVPRSS